MSFLENAYSLVHQDNAADVPSMSELRTQLEKGTDDSKVETMKRILTIMLNGDPMPQLLMHIIRFVMPSKSKALKKLLYFYYEICPKLDAQGKLKQEMILVWYAPPVSLHYDSNACARGSSRVCHCLRTCTNPIRPLTAMVSGTTSSTPTNTSEETPSASYPSSANPSLSSLSCPRPALASSTATPTSAKTPYSPSPPFTSTHPTSFPTPRI